MYFLERKEVYAIPNVLGNCSMPVHTYKWKQLAICEAKEPLLKILNNLDKDKHRITNNLGGLHEEF